MLSVTEAWGSIYRFCGEDDYTISVYGSIVMSVGVFILGNLFYAVVDVTGKPEWFTKYRIQDDSEPLDAEKYKKAVKRVALNILVGNVPISFLAYYLAVWRGAPCGYDGIPDVFTAVWQFIVCLLVEEFGFYYSHRLFHHPVLYKRFHKIHHEWTAPVGIVSICSHPIEHIISNLIPLILGPIIAGSHLSLAWLWYVVATLNTTNSHSGYHLPFFLSPEAHDFHHLKFNNCYGVLGILDWLHGTNEAFKKTASGKRHRIMLGFTPANQMYSELFKEEDELSEKKK